MAGSFLRAFEKGAFTAVKAIHFFSIILFFYFCCFQISDKFKKGEITLESAEQQAVAESTSASPDSPRNPPTDNKDSGSAVNAGEATVFAETKTSVTSPTSTGGNKLLWAVIIILTVYLLLNHIRWRRVNVEVNDLQSKVKALEAIISKINHP